MPLTLIVERYDLVVLHQLSAAEQASSTQPADLDSTDRLRVSTNADDRPPGDPLGWIEGDSGVIAGRDVADGYVRLVNGEGTNRGAGTASASEAAPGAWIVPW